MQINYNDTIHAQSSFKEECLKAIIRTQLKKTNKTIIVLDDDPTGTQTMHNVPVLTNWDVAVIEREVNKESDLFYILTNSRSMIAAEANVLHKTIGENIFTVFNKYNKEFIIISRSDSTLRGHFPNDTIALASGLQIEKFHTAVIPVFFEGGRYTIDDVHYVKEGNQLITAAETSFAKDKAFGFSNSNLKKWIEEKSKGITKAEDVVSFSITELRTNSVGELSKKISKMPPATTFIVNAAAYYDVEKFVLAYFQSGVEIIFRTAASFVKAISGIEEKELLSKEELVTPNNENGGVIVVGSYVPKTTSQLQALLQQTNLACVELDVTAILNNELNAADVVSTLEQYIISSKDVVVYTSRNLSSGKDEQESLTIGNKIANFITALMSQLKQPPRFIVAKGGITSSDIATKALGIKRALVLGQALPAVPVWRAGDESKFPGLSYIIFPGNVGDDNALLELYQKLLITNY